MMKTILFIIVLIVAGLFAAHQGYLDPAIEWVRQHLPINEQHVVIQETPENGREILYWYDPMHPNQRFDAPGPSPFMDMDLVPRYADADDEPGPDQVRVTPGIQQAMGIRTARVEHTTLAREIDTFGIVEYDEGQLSHVHIRVDGWIERLTVSAVGDAVERGQTLFELYSPTLVNAQDEFIEALASGRDGLIRASRSRLRALGMSPAQIESIERDRKVREHIPVHAHHDGVVTALGVRHGMYVTPGTEIMALADLATVWVIAEVFDRHAGWLATGQSAEVTLPYLPSAVRTTEVDHIYPRLDSATRTVRVRLLLDNTDRQLRPGMWTSVRIQAAPREEVIAIPREALIRTGKTDRVVLRTDDQHFQVRQVVAGMESGDRVEILEGLGAGEEVVVSGQFLIDSEASIRAGHDRLEGVDHHQH